MAGLKGKKVNVSNFTNEGSLRPEILYSCLKNIKILAWSMERGLPHPHDWYANEGTGGTGRKLAAGQIADDR
jgi:hypothetical protein